jgi:hypothetical protein
MWSQRGRAVCVSEETIGKEIIQGTAADKQNQDCAPELSLGNSFFFLRNEPIR